MKSSILDIVRETVFETLEETLADIVARAVAAEREAWVQRLRGIEWQGCGCSMREEASCPACDGSQPFDSDDPRYRGHRRGCWLAEAIGAPATAIP